MQLDTHVLINGSCLAANDTYDMIVCPSNTYKLPASQFSGLCAARGLHCPAVRHRALLEPCFVNFGLNRNLSADSVPFQLVQAASQSDLWPVRFKVAALSSYMSFCFLWSLLMSV